MSTPPHADTPADLEATVTHTIGRLQKRTGARQADLAKALGTSRGPLSQRLLGKAHWRINDLPVIADFFKVTVTDLMTPYDEIPDSHLPEAVEGRV